MLWLMTMDIPRISLSPDITHPIVRGGHVEAVPPMNHTRITPKPSRPGFTLTPKRKMLLTIAVIGTLFAGGMYALFTSFIQWDDEESTVEQKQQVSISPIPTAEESRTTPEPTEISVNVKGKVTVTFLKDKRQPFDNGVVQLVSSTTGAVVGTRKTGPDGTSGVVVFDEVPAGTYRVIGARESELGVRQTSASVALAAGEFVSTTIKLMLDTPVSITVTVKRADGSPMADQTLKMIRSKGAEGNEVFSVQTNSSGVFTQSGVSPGHDWKLLKDDAEIATMAVAPTGENQSINVQANSN